MDQVLELQRLIGCSGLPVVRAGCALIFALGSAVVVREEGEAGNSYSFLRQHSDEITCLALSRSGRWLATGQQAALGFAAPVVIWDLAARQPFKVLDLHRVKCQAVSFSPCERFVATLGGEGDGRLLIWSLETGQAVCGTPAHTHAVTCLAFLNHDSHRLVTAGTGHLREWRFDQDTRKLRPTDVALGTLRRNFSCLEVDPSDTWVFAGTTTGDVVQVSLAHAIMRNVGPAKNKVHHGVTSMCLLPGGQQLLLGGGDGSVAVLGVDTTPTAGSDTKMSILATTKVASSPIASLVLVLTAAPSGAYSSAAAKLPLLLTSAGGELFKLTYSPAKNAMAVELVQTAPASGVTDVAFPDGYADVFATAEHAAIRVWQASTGKELLRISVPNVGCTCVAFAQDGKSILSGWADGCIRAFGPQSGKQLYIIHNAHNKGVTAIIGTADSRRVVSGGEEGAVRVWSIGRGSQTLEATMKQHTQAVNSLALHAGGQQVASASNDGSIILWNLATFQRSAQMLDNTTFNAVVLHPQGTELAACGGNRCIMYYDAHPPCEQLRRLEASETAAINSLALDDSGRIMVSGDTNGVVKVWDFIEGSCLAVGQGHSGAVTRVRVAPGGGYLVSVGSEGAVMLWRCLQLSGRQ